MPPLHQHFSRPSDPPVDPPAETSAETAPSRPARRRARRTGSAAVALMAALAVGGCGGSDSSTPEAGPTSPSVTDGGSPPMATAVSIDHVAGTVHTAYHKRFHQHARYLTAQVGKAVDAWFDGGFVGVDYPTTSYPDAFKTFTAQAKHDAMQQKGLMTAGQLGRRIDGVTTLKRTVALDVLAPRGKAAGVTARFVLRFRTTGHVTKTVAVTGRLFLSKGSAGAWKIFGYDVAKGAK